MSKIIRMTPEMIEEAKARFESRIKNMNCVDGKISYTDTFVATGEKAVLWYTPDAYAKTIALIQDSDKEVAWHCTAHRVEDKVGQYIVSDVLVYPQEVTGATVNTDQAEYEKWMMDLDDDTFNNLRMQGHSHVNMGTTPSSVDLEHQEKIVQQLEDDMFYIFIIWNKKFMYTAKIYDLKINTLFEPADISIQMVGAGSGLAEFLKDAKTKVKNKSYNYQGYNGGYQYGGYQGGYNGGYQSGYQNNQPRTSTSASSTTPASSSTPASSASSKSDDVPSRPKPCIGNGWGGAANCSGYGDYDDYDNPHYPTT